MPYPPILATTMISSTAHSSDIATYNNLVNAAADAAGTTITGVLGKSTIADIEWRAIALTADQTSYVFDHEEESSIFTPDSSLVADSMYKFFVYDLQSPINVSEDGSAVDPAVWTGFWSQHWLGTTPESMVGYNTFTHKGWLYWLPSNTNLEHHLYAISEELTVVPVPGAFILGMLGLSVAGLKLRKHA